MVEEKLRRLGLALPEARTRAGNYVPFSRFGEFVWISGQVSGNAARNITGVVGDDIDLKTAVEAARICALNLLAQMKVACAGDWSRVVGIQKLNGFVQAGPDFYDIPKVIDGASDLIAQLFGESGRHARSAVGVYRLPRNYAVEIDAIATISEL